MNIIEKTWVVLIVISLFSVNSLQAQFYEYPEINNYKYIEIPLKFNFQSKKNEYLLSSILKHLFDQEGYQTYVRGMDVPNDLARNNCLGLTAKLISEPPRMFNYDLEMTLKLINCEGEVVFEHSAGSGKKEYEKAYKEALKTVFAPLKYFDYNYNGTTINLLERKANEKGSQTAKRKGEEAQKTKGMIFQNLVKENFQYKGGKYRLKKIKVGYMLSNAKSGERFGVIYETSNSNYSFSSKKVNGSVTLKENGNIKIEYFDPDSGGVKTMTLKVLDE